LPPINWKFEEYNATSVYILFNQFPLKPIQNSNPFQASIGIYLTFWRVSDSATVGTENPTNRSIKILTVIIIYKTSQAETTLIQKYRALYWLEYLQKTFAKV
jgi:hypothetical protein